MLVSCHNQKKDTHSPTYQSSASKLDSLSHMIDKDEYNSTLLLERAKEIYFNCPMRATHLTLLEKLLMYGYDYVNCYGLKHFLRPGFNSRSVY